MREGDNEGGTASPHCGLIVSRKQTVRDWGHLRAPQPSAESCAAVPQHGTELQCYGYIHSGGYERDISLNQLLQNAGAVCLVCVERSSRHINPSTVMTKSHATYFLPTYLHKQFGGLKMYGALYYIAPDMCNGKEVNKGVDTVME